MISSSYKAVSAEVEKACEAAKRKPEDVTLIAVSKTKPLECLQECYEAGARDFGENKVQELLEKIPAMPQDVRWHMIGHLQRNKVKSIVGRVFLIHSVDSYRLAKQISDCSLEQNVVSNILIEVNVAEEESKYGISCDELLATVREISLLPNIQIKGLMTIAPYVDNDEENRPIFCKLRELSVDIKAQNIDNVSMDILSMGMTGDYKVAISEGATYVRVGTAIFGERQYRV